MSDYKMVTGKKVYIYYLVSITISLLFFDEVK